MEPLDIERAAIKLAFESNQLVTTFRLAASWLVDHPDDFVVVTWLGIVLYKMARYDEAIGLLTGVIERTKSEPLRYLLHLEMGQLERYRGRLDDSEPWFRQAIELDPNDATGYIYLGASEARQGKLTEAETTHRRGTECTAGAVDESFYNLGVVLRAQGRLEEAADCFRKAIEIDPDYSDFRDALSDIENAFPPAPHENPPG
ncbi:MAG: tetratricopeptide (TPR) repeat protein [Myxococcota bacterium]|jgi:tetratricopeptide (TPR) repeat protein